MANDSPQYHPGFLALEKCPSAARRMGLSISQFYRVAKRDGLNIVKVSERASAVLATDVDAWITDRISQSTAERAA